MVVDSNGKHEHVIPSLAQPLAIYMMFRAHTHCSHTRFLCLDAVRYAVSGSVPWSGTAPLKERAQWPAT